MTRPPLQASEMIVQASCVAGPPRDGGPAYGVLICGASGAGKSSLALHMAALGAKLVSDDVTRIERHSDELRPHPARSLVEAPQSALIEARGVGLIRTPRCETPVDLKWLVELAPNRAVSVTPQRAPQLRMQALLGLERPQLYLNSNALNAAILWVLIRDGVLLDPDTSIEKIFAV